MTTDIATMILSICFLLTTIILCFWLTWLGNRILKLERRSHDHKLDTTPRDSH